MGDDANPAMKPTPSEQVVFAEALLRDTPEARAAYLDAACGTDTALRRRVEALLRADENAGDFLETPPTGLSGDIESTPVVGELSEKPGDRIGRYKLLQQIGEGGCGVVYMAEQEEPVRRRVALKVIKLGMDTKSVIARFEAERQALALMDHPNIAKVLDAGATEVGRPYFVMELVRGIKITDYCDQNNLSTEERLRLFTQVCQAIQHAHQKGIIHRDIKPSNILVTRDESVAVPKVIDFGIAKATTDQRLTDKTVFTACEQFIGTPAYMSPEQAMMTSLDIDTRTDIYALGVLLYELLTGTTPFDAKDLMAVGLDAMRRIIREQEPARPSTRLSTMQEADLTAVASHRHSEATKLGTLLRGDLDWIVMKALEKDRTRRYETANGLAMDIQRHLNDEPVTACPPSRWYEFQKTVRRHKFGFAAATALIMVLGLGVLASTWQAVRAKRSERVAETARAAEVQQRSEAERQRAYAQANFQKARQAVDEYFTLVSENTLLEAPGLQPLRLQLLEAARQYYEGFIQQKTDEPEMQAEMVAIYGHLGSIYHAVDRSDDAVSALSAGLEIAERLVAEHPNETNYLKRLIGFFKRPKLLHKPTRLPADPVQALRTLQKITALWERLARDNPSLHGFRNDLVALHAVTGDLLRASGQRESADADLQKGFDLAEQLLVEHPAVREYEEHFVYAYNRLAGLFSSGGRRAEAEQIFRRSLQVLMKLATDHPELPSYRADLGNAHGLLAFFLRNEPGKQGEAEANYSQAREVLEQLVAEFPANGDYRSALAGSYRGLALMIRITKRPQEAEAAYRKSQAVLERLISEFPSVPDYRRELADTLDGFGDLISVTRVQEAVTAFRQALAVRERLVADFPTVDSYGRDLRASREQLAGLLVQAGQSEEADKLYREDLALLKKQLGNEHPQVANALHQLAKVFHDQGRLVEAEAMYREALAMRRKLFGNEHLQVASSLTGLAFVLTKSPGREPEVEAFCREALAIHTRFGDSTNSDVAFLLDMLAGALRAKGNLAESESTVREVLAIRQKLWGKEHPDLRHTFHSLGEVLYSAGKLGEAEAAVREELALTRKLGNEDPQVSHALLHLGNVLAREGKYAEAKAAYRDAAEHADPETLNGMAWWLATTSDPKLRDGPTAVGFAEKAVAGTNRKDPVILDTLAAAYAETGLFTNAVVVQQEAIALLQDEKKRNDYASRLRLYESGFPYRDYAALEQQARMLHDQGRLAEAEAGYRELLPVRRKLSADDTQLAATLAGFTTTLLAAQKFADARTTTRECLTIREKQLPDDWLTFNARSLLGGSLLGQKKYADAEPLLLTGYEGMKQREEKIPAAGKTRPTETIRRLVQLYEATGRADQAAAWKQKLPRSDQAEPSPPKP